jgi:hypothetical protein
MAEDSLKEAVEATRRAAKDLASASARLTKRVLDRAETAAHEPSATAKKAAHRVAQELDAAAKEIDRILKDL